MSSMNPFDPAVHLASLWGRSGDAILDAQRSLVQELAGWMPSVAPEPGAPNEAARRAFARSWETALDVSRAAAANLSGPGDPALAETLDRLLDPAAWFAGASGHGPGLGDMTAVTSVADAVMLVQRRGLEHDVVLVEAWMQAAGAFTRAMNAAAGQGIAPGSPDAVAALWSEHSDPILAETERSDAFRHSRDRLDAARAALGTAQRAVGQIYGYASHRDLDKLRDAVEGLRQQVDEALARPEPALVDPSAPTTAVEPSGGVETSRETTETGPQPLPHDDAGITARSPDVPGEARPRPAITEPQPRYVVRSNGDGVNGDDPALLLVGPPEDKATRKVADSVSGLAVATREIVWTEAAWRGSLGDLVRDLATALTSEDISQAVLVGIGAGVIPLACLAARRDLPAIAVVDGAVAFDVAEPDGSGPDWLAAIRHDNAVMRGTLTIDSEPIDLAAITCPVLNLISGGTDGPAETSRALAHLVASDEYTEHRLLNLSEAGPVIANWLADRDHIGFRPGHDIPTYKVS